MRNISKNMQRPLFKKKSTSSSSSTIKSLPKDLLVKIVASVASHSFIDLHNVKKSCKDLLEAAEDNYVYRRVSLDKFSFIPRYSNDKELSFLKRCKENQNIESLYREGLRECLGNGNAEGLKLLDMAANEGHKEAKYVYGIILLCSSRQNKKLVELGLWHLRFLRESKCVVRTRNKVEEFVRIMLKNKGMFTKVNTKLPLCPFKNTCKGWRVKKGRWTLHDDDDDDILIESCEYCRWDYELEFFYDLMNIN
ncbi:hypothetical protein HN51_003142 [Arachis hypogaea]|uniref:F-box domain-containing protein n=1 Tax=Arachis hypogaea TaxID=3818 RepID=A0A445EK09_ARAHY|nr:putative F-box protein At1g67623 [Arachis hypogaea]QHO51469.1 Putative F-box protein [Arachis hypogaea]RYR75711.1 hypothetical protein Ahy_A01g000282 [Arachis hypogaea]